MAITVSEFTPSSGSASSPVTSNSKSCTAGSALLVIFYCDEWNTAPVPTCAVTGATPELVVPSDHTAAANYTVSTVTLSMASGATLDAQPYRNHFGRSCAFLPTLGVIVYQQETGTPLAFRPA